MLRQLTRAAGAARRWPLLGAAARHRAEAAAARVCGASPARGLPSSGGAATPITAAAPLADPAALQQSLQQQLPPPLLRAAYEPPAFLVPRVRLEFDLDATETVVTSSLDVQPQISAAAAAEQQQHQLCDLVLNGEDISLRSVHVNGVAVTDDVRLADGQLTIPAAVLERATASASPSSSSAATESPLQSSAATATFRVDIVGTVCPRDNASGSGLYIDGGGSFMTQCEAHGFRKIAFFPDRPDVLSLYERVTLRGDAEAFPVLLSNGNLVSDTVDAASGRRVAVWCDPHPKPCYLFALVGGDLARIRDGFVTRGGRNVELALYSEHKDLGDLRFAMASLKQAMAWDEARYGLEYDLDQFNVVATDFFNMGAMENKGLNVFNTSYLVGGQHRSTDADLENIAAVVAHEYFHNWTGNRVTCRDWFQLTLKEGLTVFRDQQFSADVVRHPSVQRIDEVVALRTLQFKEDAGGMAHPVRPESVVVQDNFYTVTVYEKGAEVVRMIHTLLGETTFRRGMDAYFAAFDGQAVTCDDFRLTMAAAAAADGRDDVAELLRTTFEHWYTQDGTPELSVDVDWLPEEGGTAVLRFAQWCPPSPGTGSDTITTNNNYYNDDDETKAPFVVPVRLGFFDAVTGAETGRNPATGALQRAASDPGDGTLLLHGDVAVVHGRKGELRLRGVPRDAVPSVLRGLSAPVKVSVNVVHDGCDGIGVVGGSGGSGARGSGARAERVLAARMAADPDPVSRYSAAQELGQAALRRLYDDNRGSTNGDGGGGGTAAAATTTVAAEGDGLFFDLFERVLGDVSLDASLRAQILTPPGFGSLVQRLAARSSGSGGGGGGGDDFGGGGGGVNPLRACAALDELHEAVADRFAGQLLDQFAAHAAHVGEVPRPYVFSAEEVSRRRFANFCLGALSHLAPADGAEVADAGVRGEVVALCERQFLRADNMTDCFAALQCLARLDADAFARCADAFLLHHPEQNELKWLQVQATCPLPGALDRVTGSVMTAGCYDALNPNKIRAVVGGFARANPRHFHAADGAGYRFLGDEIVRLDPHNSQVAAGLAKVFLDWHYFDARTQGLLRTEMGRVLDDPKRPGPCSPDVAEVLASALQAAP